MALGDYNTQTGAKNKYNTVTGKLVGSSSSSSSSSSGGGSSAPAKPANDPSNQYNTQTGALNPNYVNPSTGKASNDPSNQYNTNTGQLNTNYIPASVAPTNAAQIVQTPDPKLPDTTPDTGNISNASAGTSSIATFLENMQKQNEANEKARVEAEKLRATETQSMLSKLLGSTTSPSQARADAEAKTGVNVANYFAEEKAKIAEIESLTTEYNAVKAAKDQQIALIQDKMGSMNFINNQTAQIERNSAPKLNELSANINSKAAVLQASQGMFSEAQTYISQAVADVTADTKYKMDLFTTFYEVNQDSIDRLDSIYQDAFKTSMDLATVAYEQQVTEKTAVGNLIISNPQAGIQITDSLDQAYAKIGIKPKTSSQIIGSAETGYTNVVSDSSGRVISQTKLTGGTSGSGNLSASLNGDLAEDLAYLATLSDRAVASDWLVKNKTALLTKYNEASYNKLLSEVDRLFPISSMVIPESKASTSNLFAGVKTSTTPIMPILTLPGTETTYDRSKLTEMPGTSSSVGLTETSKNFFYNLFNW